jgi:uncharacterized RDD family membrane protein YckC
MSGTPGPAGGWVSPDPAGGPAPGVEFAPYGGRLVAYIIDTVIDGIIVTAAYITAAILILDGASIDDPGVVREFGPGAALGFIVAIIGTLVGLLYFPFFWARGGQTPGMIPFSLRVVRDSDGGRVGWGAAILRLIGLWVGAAVFYLGYIWIFIDKRRRGWQDLIAGTIVVKEG